MSTSRALARPRQARRSARPRARDLRRSQRLARLPPRRARAEVGRRSDRRIREGGAPRHARRGARGRLREKEGRVQLLQGRDLRRAGEPGPPRLPCGRAQRAVAHRHHGVRAAGRQGLPFAHPRLLRRRAGCLVDRDEPERRARQLQPRGRVREAFRRAAPGDPLRSRMPLSLAGVDCDLREESPGQVDVEEGLQPRQLGGGSSGGLRTSFFHHRDWSGVSIPEFCRMLDSYLRYYNEGRPKEGLGWMSPMQYRRSLGLAA